MNGEQIIPPITDPLGQSWRQPHRRFIELDDTHALMSEQTFKALKEYSTTIPTGIYDGKMWKGFANGEWYLVWFAPDEAPDKVRIEKRKNINSVKLTEKESNDNSVVLMRCNIRSCL